jgi:hypothetical protein
MGSNNSIKLREIETVVEYIIEIQKVQQQMLLELVEKFKTFHERTEKMIQDLEMVLK